MTPAQKSGAASLQESSIGNFQRVAGGGLNEFRVSAIHGYASDLLLDAEILVAFAAEFTFAAGPVHPRNAHAVADFQIFDRRAFFHDAACDFVSEDQRSFDDANELWPIAIGHVQIRMADATRFDLDQHFVRAGLRLRDLFDAQWRFEFAQDGGFHCVYLNGFRMVT